MVHEAPGYFPLHVSEQSDEGLLNSELRMRLQTLKGEITYRDAADREHNVLQELLIGRREKTLSIISSSI